jgi:hypothetical protein
VRNFSLLRGPYTFWKSQTSPTDTCCFFFLCHPRFPLCSAPATAAHRRRRAPSSTSIFCKCLHVALCLSHLCSPAPPGVSCARHARATAARPPPGRRRGKPQTKRPVLVLARAQALLLPREANGRIPSFFLHSHASEHRCHCRPNAGELKLTVAPSLHRRSACTDPAFSSTSSSRSCPANPLSRLDTGASSSTATVRRRLLLLVDGSPRAIPRHHGTLASTTSPLQSSPTHQFDS